MALTSNEHQLQLTLQAFERDPQLSIRNTTQLYNIPRTTLSDRINGRSTYTDTIINSQKLTALKEEVIIRKILDLNLRGFPPRIYNVEDIANRLLATYDAIHIGRY